MIGTWQVLYVDRLWVPLLGFALDAKSKFLRFSWPLVPLHFIDEDLNALVIAQGRQPGFRSEQPLFTQAFIGQHRDRAELRLRHHRPD
jgi:hypothetical protein